MAAQSQFDLEDDALMNDINMTPFIDVMLVLLIVFMITLPVINHAVKVNLPKATASSLQKETDVVDISITAEGSIRWNKKPMDDAAFANKLSEVAKSPKLPSFRIYADKASAYGRLIWVMTSAQKVGLTKFSFITENDESNAATPQT